MGMGLQVRVARFDRIFRNHPKAITNIQHVKRKYIQYNYCGYQGECGVMYNGIWLPAFGSERKMGRCTTEDLLPISEAGTANSNSKARTRVNNSAFIL